MGRGECFRSLAEPHWGLCPPGWARGHAKGVTSSGCSPARQSFLSSQEGDPRGAISDRQGREGPGHRVVTLYFLFSMRLLTSTQKESTKNLISPPGSAKPSQEHAIANEAPRRKSCDRSQ